MVWLLAVTESPQTRVNSVVTVLLVVFDSYQNPILDLREFLWEGMDPQEAHTSAVVMAGEL